MSLMLGIALFSFPARKNDDTRDFSQFYCAAQIVRRGLGRQLYDLKTQVEFQSKVASVHVFYNHPPFEALLFLPFTYFNYRAAYTLWTVTGLALLVCTALLIESHTKVSLAVAQYARVHADFGLVVIIFLTFGPATTCLLIGQDSMLMLSIYTLAFILLKRGAEFQAGCVLACGLFKFQFIVPFVLILVLRKKWSTVSGVATVGALLVAASTKISGGQVITEYPRFLLLDRTYQQIAGFAPEYMPNIRGLLYLATKGRLPVAILGGLVAIFSLVALWLAAKNWQDRHFSLSFSASLFATLLASYHLYNYDLTLLLLPIAIVCGELAQRRRLLSIPGITTAALILLFTPPMHRLLLLHGVYALMCIPILVLFISAARLIRFSSNSQNAIA